MTLTDKQLPAILRRVDMYYAGSEADGTVYDDIIGLAAAYRALLDEVAALRHDIARHMEIANEHLAEIEKLQAKDVCMCGDYMDAHTESHGHTPVSVYDYAKDEEVDRLRAENDKLRKPVGREEWP